MASWLPAISSAARWELEATLFLRGGRRTLRASYRDPIAAAHAAPRRFDSALEERFFRELRRAAPRWQVLREADPLQVGRRILHPDFTLVDEERGLRLAVELVGFWTPEYLAAKAEALAKLPPGARWIVCLDETLSDSDPAAASGPHATARHPIFRFRRRIDVTAFLAFVEELLAADGGAILGRGCAATTSAPGRSACERTRVPGPWPTSSSSATVPASSRAESSS
jgi:predicted nuclease of restriction endonuclease-like RecB superfamily